MTPETMGQLVQTLGSAGAILVAALLALRHLFNQLSELQEKSRLELIALQDKRLADAQLYASKLLELVHIQHEDRAMLVKPIESNADAVRELRILIESLMVERNVNTLPRIPRR